MTQHDLNPDIPWQPSGSLPDPDRIPTAELRQRPTLGGFSFKWKTEMSTRRFAYNLARSYLPWNRAVAEGRHRGQSRVARALQPYRNRLALATSGLATIAAVVGAAGVSAQDDDPTKSTTQSQDFNTHARPYDSVAQRHVGDVDVDVALVDEPNGLQHLEITTTATVDSHWNASMDPKEIRNTSSLWETSDGLTTAVSVASDEGEKISGSRVKSQGRIDLKEGEAAGWITISATVDGRTAVENKQLTLGAEQADGSRDIELDEARGHLVPHAVSSPEPPRSARPKFGPEL